MEILGIKFAPVNVPMYRRLQTLAVAAWYVTLPFGGLIGWSLTIYSVLCTRFWWIFCLYLIWIYIDKDTCKKGGRPKESVKNWRWWVYLRHYFPLRLTKTPEAKLDPKRNYLFCSFPHGLISTGAFSAFATNASEKKELFPHHDTKIVILTQHFYIPGFRELAYGLGAISCEAESIAYVLSRPEGGNVAVLMPGGASEAYYCRPGNYKVILKNRKGFVKLALKTGAPLVPVINFGEIDLFEQLDGPNLRRLQEFVRRLIKMAPVIPIGRGFFQYSFGILPQRRPVTTVVGKPLDVQKIENPTQEQVEELHERFTSELVRLFEEQKYLYLKNAKNVDMEIV